MGGGDYVKIYHWGIAYSNNPYFVFMESIIDVDTINFGDMNIVQTYMNYSSNISGGVLTPSFYVGYQVATRR